MPVIGYLYEGSPEPTAQLLAAFRKGLSETGYVEGDEVAQSGIVVVAALSASAGSA